MGRKKAGRGHCQYEEQAGAATYAGGGRYSHLRDSFAVRLKTGRLTLLAARLGVSYNNLSQNKIKDFCKISFSGPLIPSTAGCPALAQINHEP